LDFEMDAGRQVKKMCNSKLCIVEFVILIFISSRMNGAIVYNQWYLGKFHFAPSLLLCSFIITLSETKAVIYIKWKMVDKRIYYSPSFKKNILIIALYIIFLQSRSHNLNNIIIATYVVNLGNFPSF